MSEKRPFHLHPARQKRDFVLPVVILIAAVVLAAASAPMVYSVWYQPHYRAFISALSDSTACSYRSGCLRAETEDGAVRVSEEHGYKLYALLTEDMGRLRRSVPEEEPGVTLYYGDGAALEVWQVELTDVSAGQPYGVLWRFTSAEGRVWSYDSDDVLYSQVDRCVSLLSNEPWDAA